MMPVVLTDAETRAANTFMIDEIYKDRDGLANTFGIYIGDNARGEHLFHTYVLSHDPHTVSSAITRAARDLILGGSTAHHAVSSEANLAAQYGPKAMRARALRGIPKGLAKGGLAVVAAEVVRYVVRHAQRPHYYVPADGRGATFIADLYL